MPSLKIFIICIYELFESSEAAAATAARTLASFLSIAALRVFHQDEDILVLLGAEGALMKAAAFAFSAVLCLIV